MWRFFLPETLLTEACAQTDNPDTLSKSKAASGTDSQHQRAQATHVGHVVIKWRFLTDSKGSQVSFTKIKPLSLSYKIIYMHIELPWPPLTPDSLIYFKLIKQHASGLWCVVNLSQQQNPFVWVVINFNLFNILTFRQNILCEVKGKGACRCFKKKQKKTQQQEVSYCSLARSSTRSIVEAAATAAALTPAHGGSWGVLWNTRHLTVTVCV